MSIEREFEGETVTDATIEACKELGISRDAVSYTHLTLPTNREV